MINVEEIKTNSYILIVQYSLNVLIEYLKSQIIDYLKGVIYIALTQILKIVINSKIYLMNISILLQRKIIYTTKNYNVKVKDQIIVIIKFSFLLLISTIELANLFLVLYLLMRNRNTQFKVVSIT